MVRQNALLAQIPQCVGVKNLQLFVSFVFLCVLCVEAVCSSVRRAQAIVPPQLDPAPAVQP
jgi:hypothetical protein